MGETGGSSASASAVASASERLSLGAQGEAAAAARYAALGYRIIERNWRCALGELDLILRAEQVLIICEVKTRRTDAFGAGYVAVDARKQRRLRRLAEAFTATAGWNGPVRFDVASVRTGGRGLSVELFMDAF